MYLGQNLSKLTHFPLYSLFTHKNQLQKTPNVLVPTFTYHFLTKLTAQCALN